MTNLRTQVGVRSQESMCVPVCAYTYVDVHTQDVHAEAGGQLYALPPCLFETRSVLALELHQVSQGSSSVNSSVSGIAGVHDCGWRSVYDLGIHGEVLMLVRKVLYQVSCQCRVLIMKIKSMIALLPFYGVKSE